MRDTFLLLEAYWQDLRARRQIRHATMGEIVDSIERTPLGRVGAPANDVGRVYRRIGAGSRIAERPTCLQRALGLTRMLRRHGHPARLVIGVRGGGTLEAGHAWVVLDDSPFEEPAERIAGFFEFLTVPRP